MNKQEIKQHIEERANWKKGISWWAEKLSVPEDFIREALDMPTHMLGLETMMTSNANDSVEEKIKEEGLSQSYEEFLKKHGIDRKDVTNVWFKEKASGIYFSVETRKGSIEDNDFKEDLINAIKKATPKAILPITNNESEHNAAIINLYDAHFDKISQISRGVNIEDNMSIIRNAFSKILYQVKKYKPELIYIPIGNDFFNSNDFRSTTKRGIPQQDSIHWKQGFQAGTTLIRELIESCATHFSTVVVVPIEGNHDADKVFYLNEVVKAAYENNEDIITIEESKPRMYFKYGENMIGFGHGYNEKRMINELPLLAAEEEPEMWGSTKYREMFLGDIHHKQEHRFTRKIDKKGFTVNFLRDITLNHSDWDRNNGYHKGVKTIEAYIFDKNNGQIANLKINI